MDEYGCHETLKNAQAAPMRAELETKHVMGILSTGFGKSVIFTAIPLMMDLVGINIVNNLLVL